MKKRFLEAADLLQQECQARRLANQEGLEEMDYGGKKLPPVGGYVFIETGAPEPFKILGARGTTCDAGSPQEPWPLPETDDLRQWRGAQALNSATHYLTTGQKVRITAGPLQGLRGIIVRRCGDQHFELVVDLIRQALTMRVHNDDLELISPTPCSPPS